MENQVQNPKRNWLLYSLILNGVLLLILYFSYQSLYNSARENYLTLLNKHYERKAELFKVLPNRKNEIIFLGNSITEGANWAEMFENPNIKNRGISGDLTAGVLKRIDEITESKPQKIFLMIGTNDLGRGINLDEIVKNYQEILTAIKAKSGETKIYVQSILPINQSLGENLRKNKDIVLLNKKLEALAAQFEATYIDLFTPMSINGVLNPEYSNDGLHLNGKAYLKWKLLIKKYVGEKPKKTEFFKSEIRN